MRLSLISAVLTTLVSSATFAHEFQVGDRIMVITDAEIRADNGLKVDKVGLGSFLDIAAVNGDKLWVGDGRSGWLDAKAAIPAKEASNYLLPLYEKDRENQDLMLAIAQLRSEGKEYDAAISLYDKLIERNPHSAVLFNNRGICRGEKGEYDKAIQDYNESLRLDPKYALAAHNRGHAWQWKGELDKAIDDFTQAVKLAPGFAGLHRALGDALSENGERTKAIRSYDQAIEIDPKFVVVYFNRAFVWDSLGDHGKAIADLDRIIEIDPTFAGAYNARAWLRATCADAQFRNGAQACVDAAKALELAGEKDAGSLDTLAAAHAEAGDFKAAVQWQTKACEMAPAAAKKDYQRRLELYKAGKPLRYMQN